MRLLKKLSHNVLMKLYFTFVIHAENKALPVLILLVRILLAQVFWYSGLVKISNMEATLYLFEYEYKVPIIPSTIAAYIAATTELLMPIFLVIGLFTRLAAPQLFFMSLVIELTYTHMQEHIYWLCLLSTVALYGPGKLSIDYLIVRKIGR